MTNRFVMNFLIVLIVFSANWVLVQPKGLFRFKRTLECGQNETVSRCGSCDDRCPWKNGANITIQRRPCPERCSNPQAACRCKDGYYRFNGVCVLENDCPKNACHKNEKVANCAFNIQCQPSCSRPQGGGIVGNGSKPDLGTTLNGFDICSWQLCDVHICVCKDGYIRDDRTFDCIPMQKCPGGSPKWTARKAK